MKSTSLIRTVQGSDLVDYELHVHPSDTGIDLELFHDSRRIGYLWSTILSAREIQIGDFRIENALKPQLQRWHAAVRWVAPWLIPKSQDYRGKGLGRAMLLQFMAECRRAGLTKIVGSVNNEDSGATPHLLDFYRSSGFTILETADQKSDTARWRIELEL